MVTTDIPTERFDQHLARAETRGVGFDERWRNWWLADDARRDPDFAGDREDAAGRLVEAQCRILRAE